KTYADVLRIRCKAVATYGLPCSSFDNTPSVRSWFAPLVFEIGRTHAIRLQQSFDPPAPAASDCYGWKTLGCLEIQPGAETTHASIPANLSTRAALATGLTVALLGLLLIHGAKPKQPQTSRQAHAVIRMQVALVAVLAVVASVVTLGWNWLMGA